MDKTDVRYHDFENAKKELKDFSEQASSELDIDGVDNYKNFGETILDVITGRGMGRKHIVNGSELNNVSSQIQAHLQNINDVQTKLIKEFGQVYNALEALDRDYIQGIIISIKATEKTSEAIQKTQGQIEKIVENQRKTLEELKKFMQKLNGYVHLKDVDRMWSDFQRWNDEISELSILADETRKNSKENSKNIDVVKDSLTEVEKKTENLGEQINKLEKRLEETLAFSMKLERLAHWKDVDEMWELLHSVQDEINLLRDSVNTASEKMMQNREDIEALLAFMRDTTEQEHWLDIDEVWKQMAQQKQEVQTIGHTSGLHTEQLEELKQADCNQWKQIETNEKNIESLKAYREKMRALSHLEEIDKLWADVEKYTKQISEQEKREQELEISIQKNEENINEKINDSITVLTKKVRNAYWIATGAVGLAVLELLLILMRMI